jgi:hypothetical protein
MTPTGNLPGKVAPREGFLPATAFYEANEALPPCGLIIWLIFPGRVSSSCAEPGERRDRG